MGKKLYKIAIVGPESSGKTTLCEQLAAHFQTLVVHEFARVYLNQKSDNYKYTLNDVIYIDEQQKILEQQLESKTNRFLFCDTTSVVNYIWAKVKFNEIPAQILQNIQAEKYDLYILTSPDFPWMYDNLRESENSTIQLFDEYKTVLQKFTKKPLLIVSGSQNNRLETVIRYLSENFE